MPREGVRHGRSAGAGRRTDGACLDVPPGRENWSGRHSPTSGWAIEVVETSGSGPWMVTVCLGWEIVGVHRTAADADAGKRLAEEMIGEAVAKAG